MREIKVSFDEEDHRQLQLHPEQNPSHNFKLQLVQQPHTGKAVSNGLRARGMKWPIEPPPVLELTSPEKEPQKWLYIHNPNWFCVADLICIESPKKTTHRKDNKEGGKDNLSGLLASSLHKVKNPDDRNEHGYFVFGDLNVRDPGRYKLEFTLFEMRRYDTQVYAAKVDSVVSGEFDVSTKANLQYKDSTKLSKTLSESGVKIRLRKESTKRKQTSFNWSATTTDNFTFGANRPHTLAPIVNYQPPSLSPSALQHTRSSRNNGEDVSRRLSVIQNEMVEASNPQIHMPGGPLGAQHQVQGSYPNFSMAGNMHHGGYMFAMQSSIAPTMPPAMPPTMPPAMRGAPTPYMPMQHSGQLSFHQMTALQQQQQQQQDPQSAQPQQPQSRHHHHQQDQQQQEQQQQQQGQQQPPGWEYQGLQGNNNNNQGWFFGS